MEEVFQFGIQSEKCYTHLEPLKDNPATISGIHFSSFVAKGLFGCLHNCRKNSLEIKKKEGKIRKGLFS